MSALETTLPAHGAFRDALVAAGVLTPSAARGIGGWSADFERVLRGLDHALDGVLATERTRDAWFPPVMSRADLVRCGYLKSFPHLLGTVSVFTGSERDHAEILARLERDEDWGDKFGLTDLALVPAACYPLYPTLTGTASPDGHYFAFHSHAYRQEPSDDPVRVRYFRVRELVRLGTAEQVAAFRAHWLDAAPAVLRSLGLDVQVEVANDPFFGRGGRMLAATQREQVLKHELTATVSDPARRTAIGSVNYHETHFGESFDIRMPDGSPCHSACVGFGKERIVLALYAAHGTALDAWPTDVRRRLGW
ncbi:MAG: amino acid--[acyl-carrier-protein] ligase [Gemmatimonadota bacterium]|jgi:seryl-tRNA synthetase|nr:amino acid--[acyl-carrier-protein] ligase [Gemmatimonadota bacterium]